MSNHKKLLEKVDADVLSEVYTELQRARDLFPDTDINSAHEGYAIIKEEFDEFWLEVMVNQARRSDEKMRRELIQTAAMCVRTIVDVLEFESED